MSNSFKTSDLVAAMMNAAKLAGDILLKHFETRDLLDVNEKGIADVVSNADVEAEEKVKNELKSDFPDSSFLMEESGSFKGGSSIRWIVDPLDGTANFIRGFPFFCVSIAAEVDNVIFAGLVYDPLRCEFFHAIHGTGAFLNGKFISHSNNTDPQKTMMSSGIPYKGHADFQSYLLVSKRLMDSGVTLRRTGSAALDLCYVASGRLDSHLGVGLSLWDIAAGMLICREAGVTVTENITGNHFKTGSVLSANSQLHQKIVEIIGDD